MPDVVDVDDRAPDAPAPPVPRPDARRRSLLQIGVVLSIVTLAAALVMLIIVRAADNERSAMPLKVQPAVQLDGLNPTLAGHYHFAEANAQLMQQLPCYCGCAKALGHRNLHDCYIRPDGTGYESHALGCGICQGEAVLTERLAAQGKDPAAIRAAIVERYGGGDTSTNPTA